MHAEDYGFVRYSLKEYQSKVGLKDYNLQIFHSTNGTLKLIKKRIFATHRSSTSQFRTLLQHELYSEPSMLQP